MEAFWSFLRRGRTTWWITFFKDVVEECNINTDPGFQRDCLWFCFSELLQNDLDRFVGTSIYWNTGTSIPSENQETIPFQESQTLYIICLNNMVEQLTFFQRSSVLN